MSALPKASPSQRPSMMSRLQELLEALRSEPGALAELPGRADDGVLVQELTTLLTSHRDQVEIESSGPMRIPDRNELRRQEARRQLRQRLGVVQDYRAALTRFVCKHFGAEAADVLLAVDALLSREQERAINDYLRGYVEGLLKRQERQLRGVVNMASLIGLAGASADEILSVLAAEVEDLFPASHMFFHEVESNGAFIPRRNPDGPLPRGAPAGSCFCECPHASECPALSRRGAGLAPFVVDDAAVSGCGYARPAEDVGSYMCVRAIAGGKGFGVMTVTAPEVAAYADDDVRALVALSNQAALALQRNRLREELETYAQRLEEMVYKRTEELEAKNEALTMLSRRLRAFTEVFAQLDTFLDSSAGLHAACRTLIDSFGGSLVQVYMVRPGDSCGTCPSGEICPDQTYCLHLVHEEGRRPEAISDLALERVPLGEHTIGEMALVGRPVFIDDVAGDERLANGRGLHQSGTRSVVGLPLTGEGGSLLGMLVMLSNKDIQPETRQILTLFAHQLAVVLHDAETHQATRKQSEEIRALNAELAQINSDLEDFTYVVSHDLKEPLRGIEHFSRFLREDYGEQLDEDGQDYIESLERLSVRMKSLIDDLLKLSRIGRADRPRTEVNLDETLEEVRLQLSGSLEQRGVRLEVSEALGSVMGEPVHIAQLFQNLIGNAIKFNDKDDPEVVIGIEPGTDAETEDGEFLRVFVRDNGIGIAEEHHEKVFGIFQRVHTAKKYEGTGAGLTIVRKIVKTHGGDIRVESEPGQGAKFVFTLPRV